MANSQPRGRRAGRAAGGTATATSIPGDAPAHAGAIEQTLPPLLTEEQRPLFDKWKRGRENARIGAVYVLDADRSARTALRAAGIADDQFTEIVGGQLARGRARHVRAQRRR